LDRVLWGAREIGRAACVFDEDGEVDERRALYVCSKLHEQGIVSKVGGRYCATPRRLHEFFSGKTAAD
jgi:hypothetical protein